MSIWRMTCAKCGHVADAGGIYLRCVSCGEDSVRTEILTPAVRTAELANRIRAAWLIVFGEAGKVEVTLTDKDGDRYTITVAGTYTISISDYLEVPAFLLEQGWLDRKDIAEIPNVSRSLLGCALDWWTLDVAVRVPGTRDYPEDVDIVDMAWAKDPTRIVLALLDLEYQNRKESFAEASEFCRLS